MGPNAQTGKSSENPKIRDLENSTKAKTFFYCSSDFQNHFSFQLIVKNKEYKLKGPIFDSYRSFKGLKLIT